MLLVIPTPLIPSADSKLLSRPHKDMAAFTDSLSRLPLGKRANADAARRVREEMGEMIDDVEMDVRDQDEEMKEWEEAQIRRAGGGGGTGMGRDRGGRNDGAGRKAPYRAAPSEFSL